MTRGFDGGPIAGAVCPRTFTRHSAQSESLSRLLQAVPFCKRRARDGRRRERKNLQIARHIVDEHVSVRE